jgi:hypothetical protein
MQQIQLIQISPEELTNLVSDAVKSAFDNYFKEMKQIKTPAHQKEILTRQEVAEYFGVSLNCINDWSKKRIIKPYKLGNRTYFSASEIMKTLYDSNRY